MYITHTGRNSYSELKFVYSYFSPTPNGEDILQNLRRPWRTNSSPVVFTLATAFCSHRVNWHSNRLNTHDYKDKQLHHWQKNPSVKPVSLFIFTITTATTFKWPLWLEWTVTVRPVPVKGRARALRGTSVSYHFYYYTHNARQNAIWPSKSN